MASRWIGESPPSCRATRLGCAFPPRGPPPPSPAADRARAGAPPGSGLAAVGAAVARPAGRPAPGPGRLAELLGRELVHEVAVGQRHAVDVARRPRRDLAVQHVGAHRLRVALERIAVPRAARDVLPELVAGVEDDHLLRW